MLPRPIATLERVRVCKRDGQQLVEARQLPGQDPSGLHIWQKLMVYASEQSRHDGAALHTELVQRLREAGAAGATSLRGIWGYHGEHAPHGDSFWQLRRRVPVLTVVVDTPDNIERWFGIVDELTRETGVVTSEIVPTYRASAPGLSHGGLRLARRWVD
jgi:PII-like signaling protein